LLLLAVVLGLVFPVSAMGFGPLSGFGTFGEGPAGGIQGMRGIAIGADGSAYVSDVGNFRIDVFSPDGTFVRAFGKDVNPSGGDVCTTSCQEGLDGEGAGAMNEPQGVAFGPEGNLFVADKVNNRIDVFSPAGAFLRAFGKGVNTGPGNPDVCTTACEPGDSTGVAGAMDGPTGIAADSGALYVSDYGNGRIAVFSPDGTFLRAFGKGVNAGLGDPDVCTTACKGAEVGGAAGMMRLPRAVSVGPGNQIMVADTENQRIDIFSTAGAFIRAFGKDVKPGGGNICTTATGCVEGTIGTAAGSLAYPSGVTAGGTGSLYVAELNNNRVSEFTIDGTFVRAFGEGVDTGAAAFQICTAGSGCQQGVAAGTIPGATPEPQGLAVDCRGALYVTEELADFARVERFGEPGTALPPCTDAASVKVSLLPVARASNRIRFNGLKLNRRNGTAVLFVKVPGPGRVVLKGRGVRRLARSTSRAKRVRLPIKPKVRLKRFLRKHGKGRIRVEVTFRPVGGEPRSIEKAIVLRRRR
jgi:DNA-binding beta-propeller fold protein YncE